MPFTLSAAQTINGVANSYELTGSGNLDDLVTAGASVGWSRVGNSIFVDAGGTPRIFAVSGTLTDTRDGIRTVTIRNNAHVCWGYAVGSSVTLGAVDAASGVKRSEVQITYTSTAMTTGSDVYTSQPGKCPIGLGVIMLAAGSFLYDQASRSDFDIPQWRNTGQLLTFDAWSVDFRNGFNHIYTSASMVTTNRAWFNLTGPVEVAGAVMTSVGPVNTNNGVRVIWTPAGKTVRIVQLGVAGLDTSGTTDPTAVILSVDPAVTYHAPNVAAFGKTEGIKRIMRTLKATCKTPLGANITNSKLVITPTNGGTAASVSTFTGAQNVELLQSTAGHNVTYSGTGTGWTDTSQYNYWVLAFGYPAQAAAIDIKTNQGTAGIPVAGVLSPSPLVTSAYAAVRTSGFSMSTTGNGTLTITENSTPEQAAEYLFKLAYDNADQTFWSSKNHEPVKITNGQYDFGAISIVVNGATLSPAGAFATVRTTGTVTATNGGLLLVSIVDSAGDSYIAEANWSTFKVYTSAANRDARTNAIATDVTQYRFTYSSAVTYYLWVAVGQAEFPAQITVVQGANVLDLGVTGQLLLMPKSVWEYTARTLTQSVPTLAQIEASTVLAKEATVASRASQASVTALGSPLQASSYTAPPSAASNASAVRTELATELSRIDVAVSTRLATAGYTAPANADIAAIKTKTDVLVNGPTLGQIEASTVLAKETTVASRASQASVTALGSPMQASSYTAPPSAVTVAGAVRTELATELSRVDVAVSSRLATAGYTAPTAAPTAAANAQAVRVELATELGRIDAAVSSRLATAGYTAPANADIAAIRTKTDILVNGPTLAQIEASTVLAKEATVASRASQASVTALGTPLQASSYTAPDNSTIGQIKTKVDTLQNPDLSGVATALQVAAVFTAVDNVPTAQENADAVLASLPEVALIPAAI